MEYLSLLTIFITLLSTSIHRTRAVACNGGTVCLSDTNYAICFPKAIVGNYSCPEGLRCVQGQNYPCQEVQTLPTPDTSVTPPSSCTSASKYPAEKCNQFYECVKILFWYKLNLYTCPSGQVFDKIEQICIDNENCDAETGEMKTTQSSTESATGTPPTECSSAQKYPGPTCHQFYECVPFLWWYNLNLYNCPTGESFSLTKLECVPDATCVVETMTTSTTIHPSTIISTTELTTEVTAPTTVISTTSTAYPMTESTIIETTESTTAVISVTPPAECTSAQKYPAPNCNKFYECVPFLWWYNLNLYDCPTGEAFSSAEQKCVPDVTCGVGTITSNASSVTADKQQTESLIDLTTATEKTSPSPTEETPSTTQSTLEEIRATASTIQPTKQDTAETTQFIIKSTPWTDQRESTTRVLTVSSMDEATSSTTISSAPSSTVSISTESTIYETTLPVTESTLKENTTTVTTIQPTTDDITETTVSTSVSAEQPVTPPVECTSAQKYPAPNCNQFYECVKILWWYNLNLYNCPTGEAFSSAEQKCVQDAACGIGTKTSTADSVTAETQKTTQPLVDSTTKAVSPTTVTIIISTTEVQPTIESTTEETNQSSPKATNQSSPEATLFTTQSVSEGITATVSVKESTTSLETSTILPTSQDITETTQPTMKSTTSSTNQREFTTEEISQVSKSTTQVLTKLSTEETTLSSTISSAPSSTVSTPTESTTYETRLPVAESTSKEIPTTVTTEEATSFITKNSSTKESILTTIDSTSDGTVSTQTTEEKTIIFITTSTIQPTTNITETTQFTTELTTPTEKQPVTPPAECTSAQKYPAPNCNQFYECVKVLWWYNLNLYNCPSREAFNSTSQVCVSDPTCVV